MAIFHSYPIKNGDFPSFFVTVSPVKMIMFLWKRHEPPRHSRLDFFDSHRSREILGKTVQRWIPQLVGHFFWEFLEDLWRVYKGLIRKTMEEMKIILHPASGSNQPWFQTVVSETHDIPYCRYCIPGLLAKSFKLLITRTNILICLRNHKKDAHYSWKVPKTMD